jgi:hypothetical protein
MPHGVKARQLLPLVEILFPLISPPVNGEASGQGVDDGNNRVDTQRDLS